MEFCFEDGHQRQMSGTRRFLVRSQRIRSKFSDEQVQIMPPLRRTSVALAPMNVTLKSRKSRGQSQSVPPRRYLEGRRTKRVVDRILDPRYNPVFKLKTYPIAGQIFEASHAEPWDVRHHITHMVEGGESPIYSRSMAGTTGAITFKTQNTLMKTSKFSCFRNHRAFKPIGW